MLWLLPSNHFNVVVVRNFFFFLNLRCVLLLTFYVCMSINSLAWFIWRNLKISGIYFAFAYFRHTKKANVDTFAEIMLELNQTIMYWNVEWSRLTSRIILETIKYIKRKQILHTLARSSWWTSSSIQWYWNGLCHTPSWLQITLTSWMASRPCWPLVLVVVLEWLATIWKPLLHMIIASSPIVAPMLFLLFLVHSATTAFASSTCG